MFVGVNRQSDCVRTVSHTPETPGTHRDLRGQVAAHRCCVKSLIASALVGFRMRQHARRESISKRARSTTPTSLRFRINGLQAVWNSVAQNPPSNLGVPRCDLDSVVCGGASSRLRSNCVRPSMCSDHLRRFRCAWITLWPRSQSGRRNAKCLLSIHRPCSRDNGSSATATASSRMCAEDSSVR